jgi:hypothetical protein
MIQAYALGVSKVVRCITTLRIFVHHEVSRSTTVLAFDNRHTALHLLNYCVLTLDIRNQEVTMARSRRSANIVDMPGAFNPQEAEAQQASAVDADAIARRAYEIYESRGRIDGRDVEDWLQAERELTPITAKAS